VSDLAKKRMGEVSAWASKTQKVKKRRLGDKILSERVRDLVPESQAYMDLLAFERKLDATISRKRLEIQDMLRRPFKEKRKLRVFISHHFFTTEPESGEGPGIPQWELKIEGVLMELVTACGNCSLCSPSLHSCLLPFRVVLNLMPSQKQNSVHISTM
jgi:SWI/SNF-related matrix-associated actin-dependent regulator of chromatin subfamily D